MLHYIIVVLKSVLGCHWRAGGLGSVIAGDGQTSQVLASHGCGGGTSVGED